MSSNGPRPAYFRSNCGGLRVVILDDDLYVLARLRVVEQEQGTREARQDIRFTVERDEDSIARKRLPGRRERRRRRSPAEHREHPAEHDAAEKTDRRQG
ncbi:MAG: hypothetical protein WDN03_16050 [Rhizomicrobium sp.]